MRYEEPIMDVLYLEELCVVVTSSIQDGVLGEDEKEYQEIPGDGF